jgi:hypothetical protein
MGAFTLAQGRGGESQHVSDVARHLAAQSYAPDESLTAILDDAAAVGEKYAAVVCCNPDEHPCVWPDRRWTSNMIPSGYVTADPEFNAQTYQDFDERLTFFYAAFSTSDAMFLAMPGEGSQYCGGFFDSGGDRPRGEHGYTLHIPPGAPVANYSSIVLYDTETRSRTAKHDIPSA